MKSSPKRRSPEAQSLSRFAPKIAKDKRDSMLEAVVRDEMVADLVAKKFSPAIAEMMVDWGMRKALDGSQKG